MPSLEGGQGPNPASEGVAPTERGVRFADATERDFLYAIHKELQAANRQLRTVTNHLQVIRTVVVISLVVSLAGVVIWSLIVLAANP